MFKKIKNSFSKFSKKSKKLFVSISMALSVAMMSCVSAFATTEGGVETATGGISGLIADIPSVVSMLWSIIVSNPVLSFMAGCTVVGAGIGIYFGLSGKRKRR